MVFAFVKYTTVNFHYLTIEGITDMRLLTLGLAILATTGCSNNEVITQDNAPITRQYSNVHNPVKESTVALFERTRAGAAIDPSGYALVVVTERATEELIDKPVQSKSADEAANNLSLVSSQNTAIDTARLIQKVSKKSYSIYEMSRWERFCGHGDMDERDWDFVAKQGRVNLPESLSGECTEPTYTRQDYIKAWDADCVGKDTEEFKIIRSQTISPKTTCKSYR